MQKHRFLEQVLPSLFPFSLPPPLFAPATQARKTVQTDPTLLCYAAGIKEQKKCWQLLAQKFDRFQRMHYSNYKLPTN